MKKVSKIIAFGIFLLLFGSFSNFSSGLTLISIDRSGNPFPQNNATVYLSSEEVYTILNYTLEDKTWNYYGKVKDGIKEESYSKGKATINANYIFKNYGNNSTEINITIPFDVNPKDIILTANGEQLNFNFGNIDLNSYGSFDAINFSLKFERNEEKKVVVKYTMEFYIFKRVANEKTEIEFHFQYLASTGKYWNKNIDYAKFTFIIEKKENLTIKENFEIEENSTHFIAYKDYNNWNFGEDIGIDIYWTISEKKEENNQSLMNTIAIVVLIIVFISAIVFAFGYKKK